MSSVRWGLWQNPADKTYGFLSCICEGIWVCVDNLALNLVGPTTVVSQTSSSHWNIGGLCHSKGLSVVERLNSSQKIGILLKQFGQLNEKLSSIFGDLFSPYCLVCLASSSYRNIDILFRGLVNVADNFFSGRVNGLEGLSVDALDELVIDEPVECIR